MLGAVAGRSSSGIFGEEMRRRAIAGAEREYLRTTGAGGHGGVCGRDSGGELGGRVPFGGAAVWRGNTGEEVLQQGRTTELEDPATDEQNRAPRARKNRKHHREGVKGVFLVISWAAIHHAPDKATD